MKKVALLLQFLFMCIWPLFAKTTTVRVAYFPEEGFQEYDDSTGQYSGYGYEILLVIKQYTRWKFNIVRTESRARARQLVSDGQADLICGVFHGDDDAENLVSTTRPILTSSMVLVSNPQKTSYAYEDFEHFGRMRVGVFTETRSDSFLQADLVGYANAHGFSVETVFFADMESCEAALESGGIDAMLVNDIHRSSFYKIADVSLRNLYIAVSRGKQQIADEIDNAIACLNRDMPEFLTDMKLRYYHVENTGTFVPTESEREYINNIAPVRVGCTRTWYPISYFKDGVYSGPLAEVYEAISRTTGLKFEYVPYKSYMSALSGINHGEVQVLCEVPLDFSYADHYNMNLTSGLTDISLLRIQDKSRVPRNPPVVAELSSTYIAQIGRNLFGKEADYRGYSSALACMEALLSGEADFTLLNSFQAADYQANVKYIDMQYTVIPEYQYTICSGISKTSDPRLLSIMSKGIRAIGQNYITSIFRQELMLEQDTDVLSFFYRNPALLVLFIALAALIVFGVPAVAIYIGLMRRKNYELTVENNRKIDFVSKLSHDIRTPLNGILGMVYLAKEEPNGKKTDGYLKKIEMSGSYLLSILNDIMDINKIRSNKISLYPVPYSLEEFADELHAMFDLQCRKKNITFSTELPKLDKNILTDKMRFMQLFSNLISNAIKYTPEGGTVRLYCKNYSYADDAFVSDIVVADTGIGISKSFQQYMFDPFTQENSTVASMGTGLGLAIVKQIVTMMDGYIRVESEPGKGTAFYVTLVLPLVNRPEPSESGEDEIQKSRAALKGKHILVCEDDQINAEITAELIRRVGMTCDIARNGKEGADRFAASSENYYAAVLMDIRMPVMDGWEATGIIRSLERSDAQTVPIIALSADAFVQERMENVHTGITAALPKPINPKKLYESIEEYVEACGSGATHRHGQSS